MQHQPRGDTRPELAIRRLLFARGLRYRVQYPVPGMPRRSIDIAFPARRVAIFVDGCFWHRCPVHHVAAKNNAGWWADKLDRNVERDRETDRLLTDGGWTVLRYWEHESAETVAEKIHDTLRAM